MSAAGADADTADGRPAAMTRRHATRLRHYWRSHGWACHDNIDLDLLRWGLIKEVTDARFASRFLVTAHGQLALGDALVRNRGARDLHARVTDDVARHLAEMGRLVFTELSVHTADTTTPDQRWAPCRPDVFSLTRSLRPDHLAPQVHEIKVRRADLLAELRRDKIRRYRELAAQVFFVLTPDIATAAEIPPDYGVVFWDATQGYTLERDAPRRACELQTRHWMALARAQPFEAEQTVTQLSL